MGDRDKIAHAFCTVNMPLRVDRKHYAAMVEDFDAQGSVGGDRGYD
jgi:hypothetical protein